MAKKTRQLAVNWILEIDWGRLWDVYSRLFGRYGWLGADDRMVLWLQKRTMTATVRRHLSMKAWQVARFRLADIQPHLRWSRNSRAPATHTAKGKKKAPPESAHPAKRAVDACEKHICDERIRVKLLRGEPSPLVQHCPECGKLAEVRIACPDCGLTISVTRGRPLSGIRVVPPGKSLPSDTLIK